jgi:hypothetical protein
MLKNSLHITYVLGFIGSVAVAGFINEALNEQRTEELYCKRRIFDFISYSDNFGSNVANLKKNLQLPCDIFFKFF